MALRTTSSEGPCDFSSSASLAARSGVAVSSRAVRGPLSGCAHLFPWVELRAAQRRGNRLQDCTEVTFHLLFKSTTSPRARQSAL